MLTSLNQLINNLAHSQYDHSIDSKNEKDPERSQSRNLYEL